MAKAISYFVNSIMEKYQDYLTEFIFSLFANYLYEWVGWLVSDMQCSLILC